MIVIYGKGKVGKGLQKLLQYLDIQHILMDDKDINTDILSQSAQIVVSPGISPSHNIYQTYPNKITSELNFIGQLLDKKHLRNSFIIIGITATNGKSTTTHILYNLLSKLIQNNKEKFQSANIIDAYITGNFGTPISETIVQILSKQLPHTHDTKYLLITECSSFMLYQLKQLYFDYSILLNIQTDHLDWHTDFEDYSHSKLNILSQTRKHGFVLQQIADQYKLPHTPRITIIKGGYNLKGTNFIGEHNETNIQTCYILTKQLIKDYNIELNDNNIHQIIKTIQPLPHRLQLIKTITNGTHNIYIYDDGICTSAHAQLNALQSFDNPVILIAGGYNKGDNYDILKPIRKKHVKHLILIGQTTPIFVNIAKKANISYSTATTLKESVQQAIEYAISLKTNYVLFSPGAASFDMFQNVYDRVKQFTTIINSYR